MRSQCDNLLLGGSTHRTLPESTSTQSASNLATEIWIMREEFNSDFSSLIRALSAHNYISTPRHFCTRAPPTNLDGQSTSSADDHLPTIPQLALVAFHHFPVDIKWIHPTKIYQPWSESLFSMRSQTSYHLHYFPQCITAQYYSRHLMRHPTTSTPLDRPAYALPDWPPYCSCIYWLLSLSIFFILSFFMRGNPA